MIFAKCDLLKSIANKHIRMWLRDKKLEAMFLANGKCMATAITTNQIIENISCMHLVKVNV